MGAQTRLMKGDGYFYFGSREAENWLDKTISTPTLCRTVDESEFADAEEESRVALCRDERRNTVPL